METCSTENECRNRNIFVGEITNYPEINIKGIYGSLGVEGYGKFNLQLRMMIMTNSTK